MAIQARLGPNKEVKMIGYTAMEHFPGYYVNADGWLYKMRNHRLTPVRPKMNFPHGKNPWFEISVRGRKYILWQSELREQGCMAPGREKT